MILFGQIVCAGCHKILSYPLGSISCRCRNCNTVNAAQNMQIVCGCCKHSILVPINTLTFLCPCCATVTDIPESLLPRIEEFVDLGEGHNSPKTVYVTYPAKSSKKNVVKEVVGEEEQEKESSPPRRREEMEVEELDMSLPVSTWVQPSPPREGGKHKQHEKQSSSPPVVMAVGTRIL